MSHLRCRAGIAPDRTPNIAPVGTAVGLRRAVEAGGARGLSFATPSGIVWALINDK
jgi:hypothetical protein